MPQDYAQIVASLKQRDVEFVIIGGMAAVTAGVPILTRDFEICYRRTKANYQRLAEALQPFHPYLRGAVPGLPFQLDAATIEHGCNFTLITDAGDLDLLGHVTGLGEYDPIAARAERYEVYHHSILVISLEDLAKSKKAAGRPKDLLQLTEIEAALRLRKKT